MLRWKDTVSFKGIQPAMILAATRVDDIYDSLGVKECWITSGNDSTHKEGSRHYDGCAFDFRTHTVPRVAKATMRDMVKSALGPQFDVILESLDTANEHLHVEFDPK